MLALRLSRGAHPAVHLRRLLVATAAAGTGFLLLSTLAQALAHPENPTESVQSLAWCAVPLAATVHFAVAVARTDPGTRPRPGLSALGLGPGRLMAISVLTTALSCTLGSAVALLVFLHLRGDLTGMPFDGAARHLLAAGEPLPLPAALTLLLPAPLIASGTVALVLRPRGARPAQRAAWTYGRFGSYGRARSREALGAHTGFATRSENGTVRPAAATRVVGTVPVPHRGDIERPPGRGDDRPAPVDGEWDPAHPDPADGTPADPASPDAGWTHALADPRRAPSGLPWGIAVLTVGLTVEAYGDRSAGPGPALPGVLIGWALTAVGLVLAGPGLTHLCGRLLQTARPGALRLLAGRALMAEAVRIGRPLGVVCAVVSGAFALTVFSPFSLFSSVSPISSVSSVVPASGPLTTFGVLLVTGCTVATLLTAAVEARQCRADTIAALVRLGAPATLLRGAAALRAGALLALFGPLTVAVADLVAFPLGR
ncbi:hypothetical protein [Streptomyces sp. NPDC004629]|uniref:hypothetical protein n=1 Tax=Streptomyces sp. NPDC004629 TaxID=3364705 RepID=UPI0036BB7AA3